ncbi:epithelial membrane protein 1-like [Mizuhopecten yessoensis]|uniref:Voltage-dependent calcium channel gamma-1 subunit n=1 Tax=Mizuhopecten yessoensis TaxID=6573 RepID=A0A210R643_MIZYE|nr:epithelial membrane protein 1-like [Mizuhopecten yessoensis]OWF56523.1 Voltage-dependent calcium channel gamma-1 subunit [Mizuhopecten yessoensis]
MAAPYMWEKRLLYSSTGGTLFGVLLHIIAVSTTHWLTFEIPGGLYVNATGRVISEVQSGLWRSCKTEFTITRDSSNQIVRNTYETCVRHNLFPTNTELHRDKSTDFQYLDYMRTGSAFGIIALLVMVLGHIFAIYTLRRPRYILKRLTALMHLMTAACVLVENEVFIRRVEYADTHLPERIPNKANHAYGYSFVLSWMCFVFFVIAGIVFLLTSHKRKADMGDIDDTGAEEDEPVAIRR